jgi:triacylglycerol lipase
MQGIRRSRFITFIAIFSLSAATSLAQEYVILLHGLYRSSRSMEPMAKALQQAGYCVMNVNYPSHSASVEKLSETVVGDALADCRQQGAARIHFVTHSLGGILVRSYFARHSAGDLGRVVMLGPPNQGSELADRLGSWPIFSLINAPTRRELDTSAGSLPNRLGAPNYCVGVIAGNRSIDWINSLLIPGPDDGKVSVERTKLSGMADHIVLPTAHPFMMRNVEVIRQTIEFLRNAQFNHRGSKELPNQLGANGGQPFRSDSIREPAAAASRRSL